MPTVVIARHVRKTPRWKRKSDRSRRPSGCNRPHPEAFDVSQETLATHELYGLERGATGGFGWQCLVARRLVERGVRFVEAHRYGLVE